MKIHILSDLHLEINNFHIKQCKTEADVLVLAGDIGRLDKDNKQTLIQFLTDCKEMYAEVIYVAGNHEFYFSEFYSTYDTLESICDELGITFLQNNEVTIDGIKFFGTTLWTDMNMLEYVKPVEKYLNDFRLIKSGENLETFTGQHMFVENQLARYYIKNTNANVIVTHHIPIMEGVHPRWINHPANYGFANTDLVTKGELWIYGHTHDSLDFWKDGTRFVCNPKGYGHENLSNFEPLKVVEI